MATSTYRTSVGGTATGSSNQNPTATITPAVGDLFIVFANFNGNTNGSPTCADNNGGAYSLITTATYAGSASTMSAFVRTSQLANTTSTVVTVTAGNNNIGQAVVVAVSGTARTGSSAIVQNNKQINQSGSTTPAPAFSGSALTTNFTCGAVGNISNPATMTTPTNWTERQDVGGTNPSLVGLEVVTRDSGFTGTTITWGSTSATQYADIIVELDASDTGVLTQTLGALTGSSTGTVKVTGTLSQTLGAMTGSATGTVKVQGALTETLGALAISAAGTVAVHGSLVETLGALTISATGGVRVTGTLVETLGALTGSASGKVAVHGALSVTLGALTGSSSGTVRTMTGLYSTRTIPLLERLTTRTVPLIYQASSRSGSLP